MKAIWLCLHLSYQERTLVWDLPDVFRSHFLEPGRDSQFIQLLGNSGTSLFLTGQPSVMMHILEVQSQKREGKLGYIPRRQMEASAVSQQRGPTVGWGSMKRKLQAGLKLSAAWDGQTLETNGSALQLCLAYWGCSKICQDYAHNSSQTDQMDGDKYSQGKMLSFADALMCSLCSWLPQSGQDQLQGHKDMPSPTCYHWHTYIHITYTWDVCGPLKIVV